MVNVNVLEQDAIDMDFTNLTITPTTGGLTVSGQYEYAGMTYSINESFAIPPAPANAMVNEWNLYFWTTDHTWRLDVGAMQFPPDDPWGVVGVAFGWLPGTSCKLKADPNIWHIKPLPKDDKNPRPGHGVHSDGTHYHTTPPKGKPILVSGPTVAN